MYARANPRMYTPETLETPETPETVSYLDSNLCETGETLETLGSIFFRMKDDANM